MFRSRMSIMLLLLGMALVRLTGGFEPAPHPLPASGLIKGYEALSQEYKAVYRDFFLTLHGPEVQEDRQKLIEEPYAERFLRLARLDPANPDTLDALLWIVTNSHAFSPQFEEIRGHAVDLLIQYHLRSGALGPVCQAIESFPSKAVERLLCAILQSSSVNEERGRACLSLARYFKNLSEAAHQLRGQLWTTRPNEEFLRQHFARLVKESAPDLFEKQARHYFDEVAKHYTGCGYDCGIPLEEAARTEVYELCHLAIGQLAPQIEGEDLEGRKIKLTDHRGKVVFLHFWGSW